MDLGLNAKVALVAASSKGLGRAVAFALAAEGIRVVISSRDEEAVSETAAKVRCVTVAEVHHHAADLTRPDEVKALVHKLAVCYFRVAVHLLQHGVQVIFRAAR